MNLFKISLLLCFLSSCVRTECKDCTKLFDTTLTNNELDSIIATGGITEGVELEEVVVTGKNKKEQSVRGKKIDSLAGEKGKNGKYKIKRKEWYNPKTKKGKSFD